VRFDQEETIREGRAMQDSLRRYVPGAIAEELAEGADLSSREREVTVLFVDIRGYTGLSEGRRAEDIFDTINRYTETVSALVRRHHGTVVEFNGDGMMAVFGAPRELDGKERAAVEAGREIVREVSGLRVEDAAGHSRELSVGVGVATGQACVGNIRAVDRLIWSAIGNTTNLAARLQSLTRELQAAMVVDTDTRERAGDACGDFERRPDVAIRGSRQRRDLFALPLPG
jgi:adenylate cyclase